MSTTKVNTQPCGCGVSCRCSGNMVQAGEAGSSPPPLPLTTLVRVYVCQWRRVCTCVQARGSHQLSSWVTFHLIFSRQVLSENLDLISLADGILLARSFLAWDYDRHVVPLHLWKLSLRCAPVLYLTWAQLTFTECCLTCWALLTSIKILNLFFVVFRIIPRFVTFSNLYLIMAVNASQIGEIQNFWTFWVLPAIHPSVVNVGVLYVWSLWYASAGCRLVLGWYSATFPRVFI